MATLFISCKGKGEQITEEATLFKENMKEGQTLIACFDNTDRHALYFSEKNSEDLFQFCEYDLLTKTITKYAIGTEEDPWDTIEDFKEGKHSIVLICSSSMLQMQPAPNTAIRFDLNDKKFHTFSEEISNAEIVGQNVILYTFEMIGGTCRADAEYGRKDLGTYTLDGDLINQ